MAEVDERVIALNSRIFAAKFKVHVVLERAGVSRSTWWDWAKGKGDPRRKTLQKITDALDEMIANPQQENTHGS